MKSKEIAIFTEKLTAFYEKKAVITEVDVSIPRGALAGIIGPNGAGKSTLLKAILGLMPRMTGKVEIVGKRVKEALPLVGYIPQREVIDWDFPVSVMDVVLMGTYRKMGMFRRVGERERSKALRALEQVEMENFAQVQIGNLSGGQQQRVFLARALAQEAEIYFMDEPFAGVDAKSEAALVGIIKSLSEAGKTILVVHHDLTTVEDYFNHVILLNNKLIAQGSTEEVFNIHNLEATYEGKLHFFKPTRP